MEKSRISNIEWGLVIGLFICIDLVQIGIEFIPVAGQIINVLVDIVIQAAFLLYLHIRGVQIGSWKMIANWGINFFFKEVTMGALPLWTLEAVITMVIVRAQDTLRDGELFGAVANVSGKVSSAANLGSRAAGIAGKRGVVASENLKQFSSKANSVRQAAEAAQRNQLKIQGQNDGQFESPYTQKQTNNQQINSDSPRAYALEMARNAEKNNQIKSADRKQAPSNIIQGNFKRTNDNLHKAA